VALANLRDALEHRPAHLVDLEVVDVLQVPERGPRDGVLLTPMLVRLEPLPERRLLGSLSDRALLLATLGSSEPLHG
jgi:circadian clock protein KaiB